MKNKNEKIIICAKQRTRTEAQGSIYINKIYKKYYGFKEP